MINEIIRKEFEKENIDELAFVSVSQLRVRKEYLMPKECKTAIIWLLPYYTGNIQGNISLYARTLDYHLAANEISERVSCRIKERINGAEFYNFADHSPIAEVPSAATAGLGVIGENKLLINKKYGSFIFVSTLFTNLEAECTSLGETEACIRCGKCKRECPTGSLEKDDFEICLSFLTQKKGELDEEQTRLIKNANTVWGCDVCQLACPMNVKIKKTPVKAFYENRIENIDCEMIKNMDEAEFKKRAFSFRGKAPLLRNLSFKE